MHCWSICLCVLGNHDNKVATQAVWLLLYLLINANSVAFVAFGISFPLFPFCNHGSKMAPQAVKSTPCSSTRRIQSQFQCSTRCSMCGCTLPCSTPWSSPPLPLSLLPLAASLPADSREPLVWKWESDWCMWQPRSTVCVPMPTVHGARNANQWTLDQHKVTPPSPPHEHINTLSITVLGDSKPLHSGHAMRLYSTLGLWRPHPRPRRDHGPLWLPVGNGNLFKCIL